MLKKAADNIWIAFDLLLEVVVEGQAAVRQACAKASLDGPVRQVSNYAATLEKMPAWIEQLEAQRAVILESLRDQSEAQAAGADRSIDPGMSGAPALIMTYDGVCAWAVESGADVVVLADSTVKRETYSSLSKSQREFRALSERNGTLIPMPDPGFLKLTRDVRFPSKSAAAVFVAGCSVSGPREWKFDTTAFLKDRQPDGHRGLMN
jgi:hypothetical protein